MLVTTELVARIERAECSLLRACAVSSERRNPALDPFVRPIAGGVAIHAGADSPLSKLAGLGLCGSVDDDELAAIEAVFDARQTPLQVELASLAELELAARLTRRGYALVGFEDVLGRPLSADEEWSEVEGVEVSPSPEPELARWLDVVVTGFVHPDTQGQAAAEELPREALEQVIGDTASAEGFSRYLARRGPEVAGGASLRRSEGIALLCGASTLPIHRRHGVQTALLSARLADAARSGCELAVITTLPGSRSQNNARRRGFSLLYTRAVLRRDVGG
ncbi:MAG: GNAT family N-acetyltransferase [Myxococcales bacterium]|nr:GNAT family N-acetyltransferase [Myxococcales bacterium]